MSIKTSNDPLIPKRFQKLLLGWYHQYGRKDLPWQLNKTPYKVWVSEIMLQQTQVKTVIAYYERFMQKFPQLPDLANAPLDQVLHLWSGLGYYSRACNLHKTSTIIATQYQGIFPDTIAELVKLPGIGLSTASAIISLAFNQPATILDGNVKRVLARFYGITSPITNKDIEKMLWEIAYHLTPKTEAASYTQAMMDLGALICTPKKPNCLICPLTKQCIAKLNNTQTIIPAKKPGQKLLPVKKITFVIVKTRKGILLQKRPGHGIWRGLWSFPEFPEVPTLALLASFCKNLAIQFGDYEMSKPFRHTFTHFHLDIHPVVLKNSKFLRKTMTTAEEIWYKPNNPQSIGLPRPIQIIMEGLK